MQEHSKEKKPNIKILVTAGPTVEPLDPVRYISNYSSGTMGYEIAEAGLKKGYEVCLVSGPVFLQPPAGAEVVQVTTAQEMRDRVMEKVEGYDCVIMAAAVCDFRPERKESQKIKKSEEMTLKLEKTPDILKEIGRREGLLKVGFALETRDPIENGKEKLKTKDLDLIVINTKSAGNDPFGPDDETGRFKYIIMSESGGEKEYEGIAKKDMAEEIAGEVGRLIKARDK